MSELYGINELPEGTFVLSFTLIDRYKRKYPLLPENLKCAKYKKGSFRGSRNTTLIVTYKDKIVIPQKIQ